VRDDKERADASMRDIHEHSAGGTCRRAASTSLRDIANAEKIYDSYVGRLLRLTLLAPDICRGAGVQLDVMMRFRVRNS
jgi:hypothetical protein